MDGVAKRLGWVTLLLGALSGCAPTLPERSRAVDVRSVDDVIAHPERYVGRTITVRGDTRAAPGARVFILLDHDLSPSGELLVLAPRRNVGPVPALDRLEGPPMTVTGTVRRLVVEDIEREFRLDLDPRTEAEFADRLILIAVDLVPEPAQSEDPPWNGESPPQ